MNNRKNSLQNTSINNSINAKLHKLLTMSFFAINKILLSIQFDQSIGLFILQVDLVHVLSLLFHQESYLGSLSFIGCQLHVNPCQVVTFSRV